MESHWLFDQLEDCRARRQMVILDCCFSGAFAQGSKGDADIGIGERLIGEGRGRVVLTASSGSEYSFEGEPLHGEDAARGSVFTSALVDGIRTGAADADGDGDISVDDAYAYAFERVRESGTHQTPQRWLYGAEGSILLAQAPPPATEPTLVPQEQRPAPPKPATPKPPPPTPTPTPTPTSPTIHAPPQPGRTGALLSVRKAVYAVVAVLLLGGAVLAGLVLAPDPSGSPSDNAGSSSDTSTGGTSGTITASAPWRVVIRDNIGGNDVGCNVTVTNTDSGEQRVWQSLYGPFRSYQMHDSGTFRFDVNDPGCLVVKHGGAGAVTVPFASQPGIGDTDAFRTKGSVEVKVLNFAGSSSCDLELHAVQGGRLLDFGTVDEGGGPLTLDPQNEALVYLATSSCGVQVSTPG